MTEITVRLYYRAPDGTVEDAKADYDLGTFAGFLPAIGDKILDPGVLGGLSRSDPNNRNMWRVVDRIFNPRDKKDYVALVVEEYVPEGPDAAFVG